MFLWFGGQGERKKWEFISNFGRNMTRAHTGHKHLIGKTHSHAFPEEFVSVSLAAATDIAGTIYVYPWEPLCRHQVRRTRSCLYESVIDEPLEAPLFCPRVKGVKGLRKKERARFFGINTSRDIYYLGDPFAIRSVK